MSHASLRKILFSVVPDCSSEAPYVKRLHPECLCSEVPEHFPSELFASALCCEEFAMKRQLGGAEFVLKQLTASLRYLAMLRRWLFVILHELR